MEHGSLICPNSPSQKSSEVKSFIAESLPNPGNEILRDKSRSLKRNFQNMKSSKILDQDSIGSGRDSESSWKELSEDRYKRLLSFTGTDFVDLGSNSLNTSLDCTKQNSWFMNKTSTSQKNKSYPKTCWQLFTPTQVPSTENEGIKTRKIKFYPTKSQSKKIRTWFDDHCFTYNLALEKSKASGYEKELNKHDLKQKLVTKEHLEAKHKFLTRTPYQIRANSVFELSSRHKTEVTKTRKKSRSSKHKLEQNIIKKQKQLEKGKTEKPRDKYKEELKKLEEQLLESNSLTDYQPNIRFRKKKAKRQVIEIPKQNCQVEDGEISIFKTSLGKLRTREKIEELKHDVKLCLDKSQGWYLLISQTKKFKDGPKNSKFISLDPGVRTFLTGVDSEGRILEYGSNWFEGSQKETSKLDKLRQRLDEEKYFAKESWFTNIRQCYRILSLRTKEKIRRVETKISNKIKYMHKKIARDLLDEFEVILLPKLDSRRLVQKSENSNLNRSLMLASETAYTHHRCTFN